tara:strand:- start:6111 stop:6899 length:789 start_codon:yes stop_codon:yes gene_type:complete
MKKLNSLLKKDKKIFISISSKPGKVGMKFYNSIFKKMKLNMVYRAIKPKNLNNIFNLMRKKKIKGCSVSMPYKNKVFKYIDYLDNVSEKLKILNTVVEKNGKLYGYNCDYFAINRIFKKFRISKYDKILIYGTGSLSKVLLFYLKKNNYKKINLIGRNSSKVSKLRHIFGLSERKKKYDILINCSSLGMKGLPKKIMFEKKVIENSNLVIDFVNKPRKTNLIRIAKKLKKKYCDGIEISSNQLQDQFKVYTGYNLPKKYYLK